MSSGDGLRNLRMPPEEYAKRLWGWAFLNDAFDRGIRLTDIDGMVEAGGHFLFIEGGRLPRGQRIALERLGALPKHTVIFLRGEPPDNVTGWHVVGDGDYRGDKNDFCQFVRSWFLGVDSKQ